MESRTLTNYCDYVEALTKEEARRIIEIVLEEGYATKDLALLIQVSPSAISRYTHGTLHPSRNTICRLLEVVDTKTRNRILTYIAQTVWRRLRSILVQIEDIDREKILEEIIDSVSKFLTKTS